MVVQLYMFVGKRTQKNIFHQFFSTVEGLRVVVVGGGVGGYSWWYRWWGAGAVNAT